MSLWCFHEAYKALDVESVYWYPNKCPPRWWEDIPKFDGDPSSTIAHIVKFTEFVLCLGIEHEDVVVRLFLLSLEEIKGTGSDILANLKVYLLQWSLSENSLSIGALELRNLKILFKTSKMPF
jgi:hypothetical protein